MSKTLFTAALAFVLSIGGFVVSAASNVSVNVNVVAMDGDLVSNLAASAEKSGKQFGYIMRDGEFKSLSGAIAAQPQDGKVSLGEFTVRNTKEDGFKFGFSDSEGSEFNPVSLKLKVAGDSGFYGGFETDGFYQLDFPEEPFDGMIDILVMGEPLPASTVTMLVALAAAAGLLLYNNRRTRARFSAQA